MESDADTSRPEESVPANTDSPPDIPEDTDNVGDAPDIPDDTDAPPDIPDNTDDVSTDDSGFEDFSGSDEGNSKNSVEGLDEKISAIMNMNLYQQYISLLNTIQKEIGMLKNNSDVLNSISIDVNTTIEGMKKLEENIRLYIKNNYINENYSKNLLFFNKCLNLLKLINDSFDKKINIELKDA